MSVVAGGPRDEGGAKMSPSTPRSTGTEKAPAEGLSFAFPLRLPPSGTGAGRDSTPAAPKPPKQA